MKLITLASLSLAAALSPAATIYIFATGNNPHDQLVYQKLTAGGHNAVIGQDIAGFINLGVISQYDAVYLQANYNFGFLWDTAQENAMIEYVNSGGALITAEWVLWMAAVSESYFPTMRVLFPSNPDSIWDVRPSIALQQVTAEPKINAGLPTSWTTETSSIAGVATYITTTKPGAVTFYSDGDLRAVTGWTYGNGRVVNFHTVNGELQLEDANFARLLSNTFDWATSNPPTGPGVTGRISLSDYVGTPIANASFFYVNNANGIGAGRAVGSLDANGNFTIPGPNVPGTYKLYGRTSHWLRKVLTVTTSTGNTPNVGTITLRNGDCNGDNVIDLSDYTIIATSFNALPASDNWDARADLNGDGVVDLTDYTIVATGFNALGD